jgi:N-acetylglucosaminyldiphosphoundecaprenol N-acetyl-beta-D-mannosaminyltransferase
MLISYINAATFNQAFESPRIARLLRRMNLLYADGQSVVWASRKLGDPLPERVNAADFIEEFLRGCAEKKISVALVGGKPGQAAEFARHFHARVPDLNITAISDGYFAEADSRRVRERIDELNPHIVLLGMGVPRQEAFALEWSAGSPPRVWWCVGALFEYFSGSRARAPVWTRRAGLEWLFRLTLEPRRLWRRYLIGNVKFIYRVLASSAIPATPPSSSAADPSSN